MAALQEKKSCSQRMEEFQRYCWNPDTGQLLGRTLSRWGTCPAEDAVLVGYVPGKEGKGGAFLRTEAEDCPPVASGWVVQDPRTLALPGLPTRPHSHDQETPVAHFSSNTSWHQEPARWEHLRIGPQVSGLDLRIAVYSHVPKIYNF